MTPCFFDDVTNKAVSGQKIMYQSREQVHYFINYHYFTMGIAGPNFNCIPCLELEILGGKAIASNYSLFLWSLCLHKTR